MLTSSDQELRRQLEEPLNCECREYPPVSDRVLVTLLDTPYYPPYMPDTLHYHNYLEIGLCLSGSMQVSLRDSLYSASHGALIVAPKGVRHNQIYINDQMIYWRYLVINDEYLLRILPARYQKDIQQLFDSIATTGLFLDGSSLGGVDSLFQLIFDLHRMDSSEASAEMEMCVILLLQLIARSAGSAPLSPISQSLDAHQRQPIEPALSYIYEHYKEDIAIRELARSCSLSESYFRKQFLRIMGVSPLEYINRYRIHRSMNLLRTSNDAIQNIAARAGFSSIAAFNRNFKQVTGVSPSEWRRNHLNK